MAKCVVPQCVASRDSVSTSTVSASSNGVSSTKSPGISTTSTALSSDTEPGKVKVTDLKSGTDQKPDYKDKGELVISSCRYILLNIYRCKDLLGT